MHSMQNRIKRNFNLVYYFTYHLFGPSPPIKKLTSGYLAHTSGITCAMRSTPFLYTSLDTATITTKKDNNNRQIFNTCYAKLTVVFWSSCDIWSKSVCINSIRNHRYPIEVHMSPQNSIFLTCVRHTDAMIAVR